MTDHEKLKALIKERGLNFFNIAKINMTTPKEFLEKKYFNNPFFEEALNETNDPITLVSELMEEYIDLVTDEDSSITSKRFDIDFDGNLLAGIEITKNEPKVFGAMNGRGNVINPDKCKITEKTNK